MELPGQMVLFAQVVKAGSFSKAARDLKQSPSSISRKIKSLENRLCVRLVGRSSRGLSLTEEGHAFHKHCIEISDQIAKAEIFADSMNGHPKGSIKVVCSVAFGKAQLLPVLPEFYSLYPDVEISLELTDRKICLARESIDLAIRFTEQLDEVDVIARKLANNRRLICASPKYLETFGQPCTFDDLEAHNCLRVYTVEGWNKWNLEGTENNMLVSLNGNFEANSADGIYHATLAGIGIARLSTYLVNDDIIAGRLIRLFPDHEDNGSDILAIYSERQNLAPKVRVLIDHLVAKFGTVPPWEVS